jgi:hypothetical protein
VNDVKKVKEGRKRRKGRIWYQERKDGDTKEGRVMIPRKEGKKK